MGIVRRRRIRLRRKTLFMKNPEQNPKFDKKSEVIKNAGEKVPEPIPTPEEVRLIFEQLFGNKECKDLRKLEDEKGLYLWEVRIPGEGGDTEYSYMRKGEHKEGQALDTVINIVFLDGEGQPVGGHSVAKFIDGKWNLTP